MSQPHPSTPGTPVVAALQPPRARRRRSPTARTLAAAATRSVVLLVAVLLLVGTGSATARVLPGPTADEPGGAGSPAGLVAPLVGAAEEDGGIPLDSRPAPRVVPAPGGWPLRPEPDVVRGFAPPPVAWAAGHRGVDLLARPGQQVRAARSGTVAFAGRIAGRGVVVVSHGDTRTTYEPVAASVSRGARVPQGAVLGRLELLGSHCLPRACLHWGLVRGETYLDPLTLVGRGPVRLVPWDGLPWTPGLVLGDGVVGLP